MAVLFTANTLAVTGLYAQSGANDLGAAAKLTQFAGQISVLRDGNPWALNVGDLIQPKQVIVTGDDGWGLFQVTDGSTFEVFPKSKFVFRPNPGDWTNLLEVMLGKLRVKIEHIGGLPNHNTVRTPSAVISVRGTIFGVEVEDDTGTSLVWSEEGQVEVRRILRGNELRVLNPGESIRVYRNEPLARQVIDKAGLMERAARALSDTFYEIWLNNAGHGGASAPGPNLPGDHHGGNPTPPAPPPPPPPPPPAN